MKLTYKRPKLVAKITFNKKIAKGYHKVGYYSYEQDRIGNLYNQYLEKRRMATPHNETVTELFQKFIEDGKKRERNIAQILLKIRNRNMKCISTKTPLPKHSNLMNIVAHPFILVAAYRTIRKNKGALVRAAFLPRCMYKNLNNDQQKFLKDATTRPDGMNWETIHAIRNHLLKGTYPWGASRRIWIPKPGRKDSLRPITIPPFCDKLVQEAIRMVLEAIYEPTFASMNVSFGFRASCGCHENIITIKNNSQGLHRAIEGDIEEAYPKLDNSILLKILEGRINDRKFLCLLKSRLKLTLFDTKDKKYITTFLGVPQGGTDSPYLFNIYLMGMDEFILKRVGEIINQENSKRLQGLKNTPVSKSYMHLRSAIAARQKKIEVHKRKYKKAKAMQHIEYFIVPRKNEEITSDPLKTMIFKTIKAKNSAIRLKNSIGEEKAMIFQTYRQIKKLREEKFETPYRDPTTNKLRFTYTRYADDFIILGNFSKTLALQIKTELKTWLSNNRKAKLSELKTSITDLKKKTC
jgi:retron-type reverse transcriptase